MKKRDARNHNQETQFELRKQVVKLKKKGLKGVEIAEITGFCIPHISTIWQQYKRGGLQALKPGKRGRKTGDKRTLSKAQEAELMQIVIDKTPDQLKLPFALWSRKAIQMAIKKNYKMFIPLRTISDYLKRWGFSAQKPTKRAYEQNPKMLEDWLQNQYPAISKRAKSEKADIHWGDETGINNVSYHARGFSPKGKTPIVRLNAKKTSISMISSITNKGKVRFMMYKTKFSAQVFIKFLARLIRDSERKIFLIVDNHTVHRSRAVRNWLEKRKDQIEIFFLPSYSPEYNPDEYLNSDLKKRIRSGLPARNEKDLVGKTRSFLALLRCRPQHVQSYFKHPLVSYAA